MAKQQKWPVEIWAVQLASLLTGKASALYASLTAEEAESYDEVKKAILDWYQVNVETYCRRFRQNRKHTNETYRNCGDRLQDYFRCWTAASELEGLTLEGLTVLDQFLHCLPDDLVIWLRERKPKSVRQAAELADEYTMARGQTAPRRPQVDGNRGEKGKPMVPPAASYGQHNRKGGNPVTGWSRTNVRGDQQCYNCRQYIWTFDV